MFLYREWCTYIKSLAEAFLYVGYRNSIKQLEITLPYGKRISLNDGKLIMGSSVH